MAEDNRANMLGFFRSGADHREASLGFGIRPAQIKRLRRRRGRIGHGAQPGERLHVDLVRLSARGTGDGMSTGATDDTGKSGKAQARFLDGQDFSLALRPSRGIESLKVNLFPLRVDNGDPATRYLKSP